MSNKIGTVNSMKEVKITCDHCGADLTFTGNSIDWRLALTNEQIPSHGGIVTDMYIQPALEKNMHFCRLHCLKQYFIKE